MKRKRIVTALLSISMLSGLLAGYGDGSASSAQTAATTPPNPPVFFRSRPV